MKEEVQDQLFFIYTKNKQGGLNDFVGPVLQEDVGGVVQEEFEKHENPCVVSEEVFKSLYFDNYLENFLENWEDHIAAKLEDAGLDFEFSVIEVKDENENVYEDIIIYIYGFGVIMKINNELVFNVDLDALPHTVAIIVCELTKYCNGIIDTYVNNPTYITADNNVVFDEESYNQFNMDKLFVVNSN